MGYYVTKVLAGIAYRTRNPNNELQNVFVFG